MCCDAVVNSDDSLFVLDGEGVPGGENDITIPVVMAGATESFRLLAQLRAAAEAAEALQMTNDGGQISGRTVVNCPYPFYDLHHCPALLFLQHCSLKFFVCANGVKQTVVAMALAVAPLVSFRYDLDGPDGGGEAISDLQTALAVRELDGGDTLLAGNSPNGVDWRVHMEGFGLRDSAGNLWVDGAGLMDALQCAFGWQATDDEIDELLEAAGTRTRTDDDCDEVSYRLDPEGYITVMQDFEEDFGTGALGSPGSSCDEFGAGGAADGLQPPVWREQAALALEEGYSS